MTACAVRSAAASALPPLARRLAASLPALDDLLAAETDRRVAALAQGAGTGASVDAGPGGAGGRRAAVLVLVGPGPAGDGDVVLLERAAGLRAHPGQVGFPGGGLEPVDRADPVAAALREAREEVGVVASDVVVLGAARPLLVPPRGTWTTPVLAWRDVSAPLSPVDRAEVARAVRVDLPALVDPSARHTARTQRGWTGPAFTVGDLVVWGFTGVVLAALLAASGLEQPWDRGHVLDVPARFARPGGVG